MLIDSDIQYFGETVVIWDINEFMEVPKWREDALRRTRKRQSDYLDLDIGAVDIKKRIRQGKSESPGAAVPAEKEEGNENTSSKQISRKKRFHNICDELFQKSLIKK